MNRIEALEAVAEAAEILAHGAGVIRGRQPEDDDIYTHELGHIRDLLAALDVLAAHPAQPEAVGEVVEASKVVQFQYTIGEKEAWPALYVLQADGSLWVQAYRTSGNSGWERVPLPVVPVITATVEPGA